VGRAAVLSAPRSLQYKVAELSTVDEQALERVVNEHAARGWALDGVQFAMREQSKRPSMAFVFFTREGPAEDGGREVEDARSHLARLAEEPDERPPVPVSAYERLRQLADSDDEDGGA
jgi:hypothetical protein